MTSLRTDSQGYAMPFSSPTPPSHQEDDFNWDEFIQFKDELESPPSLPPESPSLPHTAAQLQEPFNDVDEADDSIASDSTASWDSRNGPRPPNLTPHPHRHFEAFAPRARHDYNTTITRDDRIRIQTALLFHIPHDEIRHKLDVTERHRILHNVNFSFILAAGGERDYLCI